MATWLDEPPEIADEPNERGEERDLRGAMARRILEFRAATLRMRERGEQPLVRRDVGVWEVANEIGPGVRQRLGLSQTIGNHSELGEAVRFGQDSE